MHVFLFSDHVSLEDELVHEVFGRHAARLAALAQRVAPPAGGWLGRLLAPRREIAPEHAALAPGTSGNS